GSSLLDQVDFIGDEDDIDIQSHAPVSLFDEAIGHIEDIMAATGEAVDVSMDLVVVPLTPRDAEMTSPSASLSLRGTGSTNKKPR
uniref:Polyprotein n=1 Tax=Macrostomum lignano TaxID=282301 RepID=A0A1I8IR68_9PLAT